MLELGISFTIFSAETVKIMAEFHKNLAYKFLISDT